MSANLLDLLERFLGFYVVALGRQSQRWLKIQGLLLGLRALSETNRLVKSLFASFLACMVITAATFSAIIHAMWNFEVTGVFNIDFFLISCTVILAMAFSYVLWSLSERRWLQYLDLDSVMANLKDSAPISQQDSSAQILPGSLSKHDLELIAGLINQSIEKKLSSSVSQNGKLNKEDQRMSTV